MRKLAAFSVLVTTVASSPGVAFAQHVYAAVRGGPGFTQDVTFASRELLFWDSARLEFKSGFTGGAALGYAWPIGLRAEGEFGYLYAPVDRDGFLPINGSINGYLAMANVYYDVHVAWLGPFKPYVGFGLGAARVHEDRRAQPFGSSLVDVGNVTTVRVDDWRTALTYQARIGVSYDVTARLGVSAGYRYVYIEGGHRKSAGDQGFPVHEDAIRNHSLELGVAFKF